MLGQGFGNFLKNYNDYMKSNEGMRMLSNLSAGYQPGHAIGDAREFSLQRQEREKMLEQQAASEKLMNDFRREQLHQMKNPAPQETWNTILNDDGNPYAQVSSTTGRMNLFPQIKPPERGVIKGADGFNYYQDTGERVLPNVIAPQTTPNAPKIITKNLPGGGEQDYQVTNEGLVPFGAIKENPAQLNKRIEGEAKFAGIDDALNLYKEKLKKYGTEYMPGQAKLEVGAGHKALLMELKDLFKLGVLAGPDMAIMESIIADPTALTSQGYSGEDLIEQIDAIIVPKIQAARSKFDQLYGGASNNTSSGVVNWDDL
jgi:hypothetical protein